MSKDLELNELDKFIQQPPNGFLFFLPAIAALSAAFFSGTSLVPLFVFIGGEALIIVLLSKVKTKVKTKLKKIDQLKFVYIKQLLQLADAGMFEVKDSDNSRHFHIKEDKERRNYFSFILGKNEIFFTSYGCFADDVRENGFDHYCCNFYPKQHPEIFNLITEWEKGRNVTPDKPRSLADMREMMIRQYMFDHT